MNKGFTLVELIIVIIIVGILASLGVSQYAQVVEKGREAEARTVLGTLRAQQVAYYLENGSYFDNSELDVNIPQNCEQTTHYFMYSCSDGIPPHGRCGALRCRSTGGKQPGLKGSTTYGITLDVNGNWLRRVHEPSP